MNLMTASVSSRMKNDLALGPESEKRDVYWPTDATEHKGNPVVPFSSHRPSAK